MSAISIDEFMRLDIRVVRVLNAEPVPGRTRILMLTVDIGFGEARTMIVGGAESHSPEHFVGRKFVALVNLTSKKFAGVESQGMLLAADVGGKPVWLTVEEDVPTGTRVR